MRPADGHNGCHIKRAHFRGPRHVPSAATSQYGVWRRRASDAHHYASGRNLRNKAQVALAAAAIEALPVRSSVVDGEAIVCDDSGLAVFDLIRGHGPLATAVHCAFDLLELDGEDLRRQPIEDRKRRLATLLRGAHSTIVLNEHLRVTARSYSGTPASSAARVSCRSGSGRRTSRADRRIG